MSEQTTSNQRYKHAVVIGASMAGLWAGRVLADHFERVTIIDRDHLLEERGFRNGVPQSRHLHLLLVRGYRIMQELFPGVDAELEAAGVPLIDIGADMLTFNYAGQIPRFRSKYITRSSSRALLESTVRRQLAKNGRVRFVEEGQVTDLLADEDRLVVTGVRIRYRGQSEPETLEADLVVDASGRNSRTPQWLEALGYDTPPVTEINAFLGYATRVFRPPPDFEADWKAIFIFPRPIDNPRGGALLPVEGNRWIVTLAGTAHDYPPTDEAAFMDFASTLIHPSIYEAIKDAEPLSSIYGYRRTENRWMHYERLKRWPERFVVIGDAACCFNPIYGQGMTVSALEAMELDRSLREQQRRRSDRDLSGLAQRFQKQLPKAINAAWLLATGEDFRWPTTEGGRPDLSTRFAHWYVDRMFEAAPRSTQVVEAFYAVQHLLKPFGALFQPSIFARVMSQALRSVFRRK